MTYEEYLPRGKTGKIAVSTAPCGLICELCGERSHCRGCNFSRQDELECCCFQRKCCDGKKLRGCWECTGFPCGKDMHDLSAHGVRIVAFVQYIKEYGLEHFAERIAENEKNGILYQRDHKNFTGDYDDFANAEDVMNLIENGKDMIEIGKA
ncbi:MAG: DUF3795 domain-containing protein [Prevotella sp.]|nr:DUF3795 domain-containing protein [Prevotella sp.]